MFRKHNSVAPTNNLIRNTSVEPTETTSILPHNDNYMNAYAPPRIQRDDQDQDDIRRYIIDNLNCENADVKEIEVEHPSPKPKAHWNETLEMPRWALVLLMNFFIILVIVTFCVVFAYQQSTVGINELCLTDSNCNSYIGLTCTAGKCLCSLAQFWNGRRCVAKRTFNRSCISQNQCDSAADLLCKNVTTGLYTDSLCWCSSYRYWSGSACVNLKTFNETCSSNSECDINDFLTCINGRCDCNSTQFWNYVYCENKRTYGYECDSTYWCNNATSGLQCSTQLPTTG